MNWTITYNGAEKTLADWGVTNVARTLASQDVDELSFTADGAGADSTAIFPIKSTIILQRDRIQDSGGVWSRGTIWFAGIVIQIPRRGEPAAENNSYRVAGPWWYLKSRVFEKVFNVFNGYSTPGDTTTATFVQKTFSHSFLLLVPPNTDLTIPVPPGPVNPDIAPGKESTGQQIVEALNWALKPFVDAGTPPPFQVGTVTPDLDVPIQEVRDITCAEVIRMMLRWSPDAVTWFDYSTSPPTFHCQRRADFAPVNIDVSQT